jgi:hypothetical protein
VTVSLSFSLRSAAVPVAICLAFAVFAVLGQAWAWIVVGAFLLAGLVATRRMELSTDGIRLVALVPLFGSQAFAWHDLGPFERSTRAAPRAGYTFAKAAILDGPRFRMLWLFPTGTVTVAMTFARTPLGRPISIQEFVALTASVRGGE